MIIRKLYQKRHLGKVVKTVDGFYLFGLIPIYVKVVIV